MCTDAPGEDVNTPRAQCTVHTLLCHTEMNTIHWFLSSESFFAFIFVCCNDAHRSEGAGDGPVSADGGGLCRSRCAAAGGRCRALALYGHGRRRQWQVSCRLPAPASSASDPGGVPLGEPPPNWEETSQSEAATGLCLRGQKAFALLQAETTEGQRLAPLSKARTPPSRG